MDIQGWGYCVRDKDRDVLRYLRTAREQEEIVMSINLQGYLLVSEVYPGICRGMDTVRARDKDIFTYLEIYAYLVITMDQLSSDHI